MAYKIRKNEKKKKKQVPYTSVGQAMFFERFYLSLNSQNNIMFILGKNQSAVPERQKSSSITKKLWKETAWQNLKQMLCVES